MEKLKFSVEAKERVCLFVVEHKLACGGGQRT